MMKTPGVRLIALGGLWILVVLLLMLASTKSEAGTLSASPALQPGRTRSSATSTVPPTAATTATPQPGRSRSAATPGVTPTAATTATLSLAIDLDAVSSQDALGELSFYVGGAQARPEQYRCQDYRDFSFAQPTALGDGFGARSFFAGESSLDHDDAYSDDALPVWHQGSGLVICGLEPDEPLQISLFDPEGRSIYTGKGLPNPIRDEPPGACPYPTSGLPQDFCYRVDEPMAVDILPWESPGIYRVEVTQSDSSFAEEFRVDPPTAPMIYYSQRANGYALAGFDPHEDVKIVRYDGARPVGVAPLRLDEHGGGLLISAQLGITATLGAVRDDLSIVSSGLNSPTVDFDALIKRDPGNALAYYGRAKAHEGIPAIRDLNTAIALDPGFAAAYEERARNLGLLGDDANALRDLNSAIDLDPTSVSALRARAALAMEQKNWELALADLSAVIDLQPPDLTEAYQQRAEIYRLTGDDDLAIDDYRQIIAANPGYVRAYFGIARLFDISGDDERAASALKQAVRLAVEHAALRAGSDEDYSRMIELEPEWALAYYARGLMRTNEEAIADLDQAIALDPDFVPAYQARARKLSYMDLEQAISAYARVIELEPADRAAYLEKAILEEATGDLAAAVEDYGESYPYSPQAYQLGARLAEDEGDLALAIDNYSALIEQLPNFLPALYHRGRLYELAGDSAAALADYTRIITTAPDDAETALYARAHLLVDQGEKQLAGADMMRALALDDQPAEQYGTMDDYNLGLELLPDSALPYLRRGQMSLNRQEDVDGALEDLTVALRVDPNNLAALKLRAGIVAGRDDPDATILAFTDLINAVDAPAREGSARELYDAYATRASLYAQQGQSENAVADYTSAITLGLRHQLLSDYELHGLYHERATLYEQLGETTRAIADYAQLISTGGDSSGSYHYALARIYEALGDTDSARDVLIEASEAFGAMPYGFTPSDYDRFVELAPDYAPAYLHRGLYLYDEGEYSLAIRDLTTAIELGLQEELPGQRSALKVRGNAYFELQDYERAIADYSTELERIGELERSLAIDLSADTSTGVPDLLYRRGRAYHAAGSYQDAVEDFASAISLAPRKDNSYYALAKSYEALGDTDGARDVLIEASEAFARVPYEFTPSDYDRFVELAPDYAPAYLYRGLYLYDEGEYRLAIRDLTTAIGLGLQEELPGQQSALKVRGHAYFVLQDYERAIADYSAAIDLSAGSPIDVAGLLNSRGNAHFEVGSYQDAILDYTDAIGNQPKNEVFYGNRGLAQSRLGRYELAVTDLSEAIDLAPYANGFRYFWWRGDAYRELGDAENAIADYQYFIEMTDDPEAKQAAEEALAELTP